MALANAQEGQLAFQDPVAPQCLLCNITVTGSFRLLLISFSLAWPASAKWVTYG